MSVLKEEDFQGIHEGLVCKDVKEKIAKMKQTESKTSTNFTLCVISGIVVVVFSLVLLLAVIQYRSEMDILRRSIITMRSDILIQMAKDREHFQWNRARKLHRRDTGDIIIGKTLTLLDTNFTKFDDSVQKSLRAFDDITEEITGIKDEIKDTKRNFSEGLLRIEQLAKRTPTCSQSPLATAQADEIIKLVLGLTDTITSLKRVMILSSLKTASIRSTHALLKRFDCTLKEAMTQLGDRLEGLEGLWQNMTTDNSTVLDDSLDAIQMDIKQIQSEIKASKDEVIVSINAKLDVTQSKCTNKDFIQTVYEDLKAGVRGITNSSQDMQRNLHDIIGKTSELSSRLGDTNFMLQSLNISQAKVGETCAQNGDLVNTVFDRLDMFNETEPETDYMFTEYCAERHGCVRVKSFKRHCYKVFHERSDTWYGADEACHKQGGYLVEINSDVEYQKLATFITRTRYYWIGGTDLNSESSWYWSNSKERVWLNAWRGSNPNNDGGVEHCMHLYANRISWNDANCLVRQSFICEKDANCDGWD